MNDNIELLKLYKNKYETDNEYIVEPKNWESLGLGGDNGFNALDFFYFSCIYKNNIGTELLFERPDPVETFVFYLYNSSENGIIIQKVDGKKLMKKDLKELKNLKIPNTILSDDEKNNKRWLPPPMLNV